MGLLEKILDILFSNRYKKKYQIKLEENDAAIKEAYFDLRTLYDKEEYLTKKSFRIWKNNWGNLSDLLGKYPKMRTKLTSPLEKELDFLYSGLFNAKFLKERNQNYVEGEINRNKDYFSMLEKFPLNQKQCQAIVVDEDRNLVIAGAGTGKTSTLIGKAGYVLRREFAKPNEVLLLSFGRNVRDEMLERTRKRFNVPVEVSTFHSLGMKIISEVEKTKPRVSKLSTDNAALQNFIDDIIVKKIEDKGFLRNLNRFFLQLMSYKTLWDFKTQSEYYKYVRSQQLRSLNGDIVNSHQELEIANYLYLNDLKYEYEKPYEHQTASKMYGQYLPDFYLPQYKIYIEHFGVDECGNTAPSVDRERYLSEMSWKRNIHKKYGTTLIETFSYEARSRGLLECLEIKLIEKGVKLKPISEEVIFNKLNEMGLVKPISRLLASFLNLYKSNKIEWGELRHRASECDNPLRANAFLQVFKEVYDEYEKKLASLNEIDFNDMINRATNYVIAGKLKHAYKYILVDEFQDISQSRYKLLKAILEANQECKIFAVGDDWQSIFRFAGSDLNIMTKFEKYFGEHEALFIDDNFRFNNKICAVSTKFILENPQQIRKQLYPKDTVSLPAVSLIFTRNSQVEVEGILSYLSEAGGSVQILGRYNNEKPRIPHFSNLDVEFRTVHRSKGTEADYVIILGLKSGIMGFPCEIVDDPILQLVIPDLDRYPHAEERRLFYVALTRARKHVYLLSDPDRPSVFVNELLRDDYEIEVKNESVVVEGECPLCGGAVVKKRGFDGYFYSCNNYPFCKYKAPKCPKCQGHLFLREGGFECEKCRSIFNQCPSCGGVLVMRNGPYSKFIGCSNYPECEYTEKLN
jgi:DNA helicase-4